MLFRISLLFFVLLHAASASAQENGFAEQTAVAEEPSSEETKASADEAKARQRATELAAEQRERLDQLITKVQRASDELADIQSLDYGGGASATIVGIEVRRRSNQLRDAISILIEAFAAAQALGLNIDAEETIVGDLLNRDAGSLKKQILLQKERIRELVDLTGGTASLEQRLAAKMDLTLEVPSSDGLFVELLDNFDLRERFGLDVTAEQKAFGEQLQMRAGLIEGLIRSIRESIKTNEKTSAVQPGGSRESELRSLKDLRSTFAESLRATIRLLDRLGLDTAIHKQALISLTGELSDDILNPEVLGNLLDDWGSTFFDWIKSSAPGMTFKLLVLVLIFFGARLLAKLAQHLVRHSLRRSSVKTSYLLKEFLIKMAGRIVLVIGLLFGVAQLGVELGPLLAGLGIAGFIVGFALQDVLSNFASGLMILFYRPFDVGDTIETAAIRGQVDDMTLVSTMILTFDNQMLVVPNSRIWGDVIRNVTHQRLRRVDMEFSVSYADDIDQVEKVFLDIINADERVLQDPEPNIRLSKLGDSGVMFIVRPWVKTDDYWPVYWDTQREVKRRLSAEGITIPFPQRDIHHYSVEDK
ncbi:MAG: mechanosensitive ion channel family protein [Pseudomonadales bacterium]|nr:mechanosensitive ion channel family protein [Pseudomonadales bacterium]